MTHGELASFHEFASRETLAEALADAIAAQLAQSIRARGSATLAVSGGSTPARLFDVLATRPIAWDRITVTLVDERFVPPTSERSNARLAARLLRGAAAEARFLPLWSDVASVEAAASAADAKVGALRLPFDVVVLGMGTDGHTASFFPDTDTLDELLDPTQPRRVMPVRTSAGGEPRLTLTLSTIVAARFIALHIEGDAKRAVLDAALEDPESALPVRRVFDAAPAPVHVYWAP